MSGPRRAFHVGSPAVIASAAKTQCRRAAGGGSPGPMPDKPFDPNTVSLDEMRALFREFPGPDLEAGTQAATREAQLTKPRGALGRLEELAAWLDRKSTRLNSSH